ncbi:MAG: hypothetical protein IJA91_00045, partial [Clostridia bacterium]|nr:hypothetical protein [Clostridia bacterium]
MKHTRWKIWGITAAVMAACLLTLTACGGDKPTTETEGQDTTADTDIDISVGTSVGETVSEETAADTFPADTEESSPDGFVMADIYPTPMEITYHGAGYVIRDTVKLDEKASRYADGLAALGIEVAEDGLPLTVTLRDLTADF